MIRNKVYISSREEVVFLSIFSDNAWLSYGCGYRGLIIFTEHLLYMCPQEVCNLVVVMMMRRRMVTIMMGYVMGTV